MNINELKNIKMTPSLAYILGLIFPLYKEKRLNAHDYIIGSVNHNAGKVTQNELDSHYKTIYELIHKYNETKNITLMTNKTANYTISPKEGFSVLIETTNVSEEKTMDILYSKVKEIKTANKEIRTEFVKGCFDGRSSWDTTAHFLSIDVDRNYERQDLIIEIIESLGIHLNVNRRDKNHKKNDQLRIKYTSLHYFMSNIGLYSECRTKIIEKAFMQID